MTETEKHAQMVGEVFISVQQAGSNVARLKQELERHADALSHASALCRQVAKNPSNTALHMRGDVKNSLGTLALPNAINSVVDELVKETQRVRTQKAQMAQFGMTALNFGLKPGDGSGRFVPTLAALCSVVAAAWSGSPRQRPEPSAAVYPATTPGRLAAPQKH